MEIEQEYELVLVEHLQEHPQNPRRGDEDVIERSIERSGWYGAVVAQRSTGNILVGNHRFRVAKRKGAERVPVIWRDVDDQTALRILLADNRSSDLGTYDEQTLQSALDSLDELDGTGWEPLAAAEAAAESEEPPEIPEDRYEPQYGVMVVCESEQEQQEIYERLKEEGLQLRVVAV